MFWFQWSRHSRSALLVIEVGSASIGMALVRQNDDGEQELLWDRREFVMIGENADLPEKEKRVVSTLMNMLLGLGGGGLKVLREQYPDTAVTAATVGITAPWAYTVLQRAVYNHANQFAVTERLINELSKGAAEETVQHVLEEPFLEASELTPIDSITEGVIVNDYTLHAFDGNTKTDHLTLLQTTSIADQLVVSTVNDALDKILPNVTASMHSLMSVWSSIMRDHHPHIHEYALIDVTSEATEIGIIRDGVLSFTSHIPYGSYTIAREVAADLTITQEEAHSYLQLTSEEIDALPARSKTTLATIAEQYHEQLSTLFSSTGDELLIPPTVYLLCDQELIPSFTASIKHVAHNVTNASHTVHPMTPMMFGSNAADTALYVLARKGLRAMSDNEED